MMTRILPSKIDDSDGAKYYLRNGGFNLNDKNLQISDLFKRNVWIDHYKTKFRYPMKMNIDKIDIKQIKLVPFEEDGKPVVRRERVFQVCVIDWDGDCILKDDLNGVEIVKGASNRDEIYDNEMYDTELMSQFPEHPMNTVSQIKYQNEILEGTTLELQLIIDLFYTKNRYI